VAAAAALAAYKKKAQEKEVCETIAEGGGSSSSESLERFLRFLEAPHLAAVVQKLRRPANAGGTQRSSRSGQVAR